MNPRSQLSLLSFSSIRVLVVFHCLLSQFPLYLLQQVIIMTTIETTETTLSDNGTLTMRSQLSLLSLLSFSSIRVLVVFHCLLSQFPLYLLQQVIIMTTIETTETTFFRQWYPYNAKPVVSVVSIVVFFSMRTLDVPFTLLVMCCCPILRLFLLDCHTCLISHLSLCHINTFLSQSILERSLQVFHI